MDVPPPKPRMFFDWSACVFFYYWFAVAQTSACVLLSPYWFATPLDIANALVPSNTKLCALHFPAVVPTVMPPRTLPGQLNVNGPPEDGWQTMKCSHCPACALIRLVVLTFAFSVTSNVFPSPASNAIVPPDSVTATNPAAMP